MSKKKKTKIDTGFNSKEEAAQLGYTAAVIERISDKEILTLNPDLETYSFSETLSKDGDKYKYSYERLMEDHRAKGKFRVLTWVKNFNAEKFTLFVKVVDDNIKNNNAN